MAKSNKKSQKKHHLLKPVWLWLFLVFILLDLTFFTLFNVYFSNKIYPNTFIAGFYVGGLTPQEASDKLNGEVNTPQKVVLNYADKNYEIQTSVIGLSYNFPKSAKDAYIFDRTGNILFDFVSRIKSLLYPRNMGLELDLNEERLGDLTSDFAKSILVSPIYPTAQIINNQVVINRGKIGTKMDSQFLRALIGRNLANLDDSPINIPVISIDPTLSDTQVTSFQERANKLLGKSIQLTFEFQTFNLKDSDLVSFISPEGAFQEDIIAEKIDNIAKSINRDPQNATFTFQDGTVKQFTPSEDGVKLNSEKLKEVIENSLTSLETSDEIKVVAVVPVNSTPSDIKLSDVNNLGIKELIGRGTSTFFHSIPSRVHNVGLAASKFNSVLVNPGETLSFDNVVGDVSNYTGYQQAYIISGGKTILGDGGGVCQVSTTLFRAALNAGLPIVERRAHAYRVGYYEQDSPPGLDATVYVPTTDLKIQNDTPGHLLIQTHFDAKNYSLIFEIYGTSDGRKSTISNSIVTNVTPAPPTLYQDDPTLPAGTLKQIDFSAAGAKVTFNYSVTRGGQEIYNKTFISNYQPWQAVYLRGTGPVN